MSDGKKQEASTTITSDVPDNSMPPVAAKQEPLAVVSFRIFLVVSTYWFVSITLVFLNKYLLSSPELKLDAPLFVTWYQCIISVFLCAVLATAAKIFPRLITFPEFTIDPKICREILPLSIIFVAMITCNNLCLKYVGVAFYFVGRSLTTVFNVICSYIILRQTTSLKAIACCAIIILGFFLGVDQEGVAGSLSVVGVIYGVLASLNVALFSIFIKKKLPVVDNNVWRLTLYNNVNAFFLFIPFILYAEVSQITNFSHLSSVYFWFIMTVGGLFGFAIGYVTGLQVQFTSPLTHNISGTAKACAQTVLATMYFNEVKTGLWWLSNAVVLLGSAAYTQVRRQEMAKKIVEDEKAMQNNHELSDEGKAGSKA